MHETHSLRRCVRECDRDGFDLCTPRRCALIGTTCVLGIWPHAGLLDDRGSSYAGSEIFYVEYVNEFTLLINTLLSQKSVDQYPWFYKKDTISSRFVEKPNLPPGVANKLGNNHYCQRDLVLMHSL